MITLSRLKKRTNLIALSIGIVYLWFGTLKVFPGFSPAEELATDTIGILTFGLIPPFISIKLLAAWEIIVGLGLIFNFQRKYIIQLALIHMVFTFTPLFSATQLSFNYPPYGFTLVGQYIVKNIIIIAALIHLYSDKDTAHEANIVTLTNHSRQNRAS